MSRRVLVAVLGDVAAILTFVAIGRASHHDTAGGRVLGTVRTAAPFLAGWFAASPLLGAYAPAAWSSLRGVIAQIPRAWLAGGLIGLAIRSGLERRVVPISFVGITLVTNLVFLLAWRALFTWVLTHLRSRRQPGQT